MSTKKTIIVITGPTASGKSELAVKLAKKINGEIISADSRQIYKGLDIGTAKITKKEIQGVKHHCLDIASPKKRLTIIDWKNCAEKAVDTIYRIGKVPIVVGGTMFYIKALIDGWALPQVLPNPLLRKKLEKKTARELFTILQRQDSHRAKTIERKNKRRLIRALEIVETLGKVPKLKAKPKYEVLWLGIKKNPEELKKRIQKRLRKMLKRGLIQEIKKLRASSLSWKRIYEFGFEYKYPAFYLQKKISKEEMINKINKETLDYTRRQMLWWKKDKKIRWLSKPNSLSIYR